MQFRKLVIPILILGLMFSFLPTYFPSAAAPDLFFSEYIEGSGNNKALEIYNGTGSVIDLAGGNYTIEIYFNGSTSAGTTIALTGSVADGGTYVVADDGADAAILAVTDQTSTSNFFNGDDAVLLSKAGVVIDAIGQVGTDPGSEWGSGDVSTANNTIRRMSNVCAGDTDATDAFDPSIEWAGFAQDTFDGLGAHTADCDGTSVAEPKLNEFVFNHTGIDTNEYVEVFGTPNTDYSNYSILQVEGDSSGAGVIDTVLQVGTTNAGGFWVSDFLNNEFENGTVTLLLVEGFTGSNGTDLDVDNDGVFDAEPWTAIADSVAINDGGSTDRTYSTTVLSAFYDGFAFSPGGASRIPNGADTDSAADWVRNDFDMTGVPGFSWTPEFGEAYNTPGETNLIIPEASAQPAFIHDIQGTGDDVTPGSFIVEAIVTADFQSTSQLSGFFIQEEDIDVDSDLQTSEGIFVYCDSCPVDVNVGDLVQVIGNASDYFGKSQLTARGSTDVNVISAGNPLPGVTQLSLPIPSVNAFEPYEGMLVTFPQPLVISEYFNFDRFGEIVLTSERHLTPTAEFEPGSPEAAQAAQDYLLDRITLDDGRGSQNPDPAIHPNGQEFNLSNLFRGGDTVANVTGVMDYAFSLYRIQPTQGGDYTNENVRPEQPDEVGGSLEVASFNVLNYFTTIDTGADDCGPTGGLECRGADNETEFTRQRDKIIAALVKMDSDVVGLIEIENHPEDVPTADLVSGLNDVLGAETYAYIATGAIGTDAIRVALIYKPATVTPYGGYAVLDSSVDSRFNDTKNRPVLAQSFIDNSTGGIFTLAVNHLKSKGSPCDDVGDPDLGDGAGNCNLTRKAAAEALVDWLATDPTGSGDADFLIMGDLNSYDKEDPIDAILAGSDDQLGTGDDFSDLVYDYLGEYAYSYVFDGQIGYLDTALANADMGSEVTDVTIWHINADEADLIDYDTSFKKDAQDAIYAPDAFRSSDHDPVIAGIAVCDEIAPTLEGSVTPDILWPPNHKYVPVEVIPTDNFDPNPIVEFISITSNEPDDGLGDGDTPNDIVQIDDTHFMLRAERSGTGEGRVYTITYQVTDACGNVTYGSVYVSVPKDKSD